ncbi:MAG: alpha-2-macroglobulin, partial [Gammaproteobacteria bacterium]|nr:alpha-2-macroglobulin [Gammaproteobacteria bacterium]
MLKNLFTKVWKVLQSICFLLFGQVSWNPPKWLSEICRKVPICSKRFGFSFLGIGILVLITVYAYSWYQKRPHPELITAHIITPKTTSLEEDRLTPDSLKIDFGTNNDGFSSKSVAPLRLINKEVTTGVALTPSMPGKWFWESDNHLVFYPGADWPAAQTYHIHFNKYFFARGARMAHYDYSFTTESFQITLSHLQFYQDPINPKIREVVATLNFNYPVDATSLEQHTTLMLQAIHNDKLDLKAQSFKYFITYDKFKRTAYLHSEPLPLPETERFLEFSIAKGVKSLSGSGITNDSLTRQVLIPDASSYLKMNSITATIVRNNKDQPEQTFTVESTLGVKEDEFNKNIHVYLLPTDYPANSLEAAKEHYQWQNPGEVTPAILALATPLSVDALPTDREYATLHSYRFNVEEPRF